MSEQRPFPVLPVALVSAAVVLLAVVAMVAMMIWGMNGHHRDSGVAATPTVINSPEFTIDIIESAFAPSNVSVPSGAVVTWTNHDSAPHNAAARDGSWRTQDLDKGESHAATFETPGTWEYYCTIHPYMEGVLTVR